MAHVPRSKRFPGKTVTTNSLASSIRKSSRRVRGGGVECGRGSGAVQQYEENPSGRIVV